MPNLPRPWQALTYFASKTGSPTSTELAQHLDLNCSKLAIKSALNSRGYYRYIARRKPPLSSINKAKRLRWAQEHINWTYNDWKTILWTDESWVLGNRHTRTWITRRKDEIYDDMCVVEHFISQYPHLSLMQDGAPGHGAQATQNKIREYGINMIYWPLYFLDLNPIEVVNFRDQMSTIELRIALQEAWDAVPEDFLVELVESMPERCKAVVEVGGGYTSTHNIRDSRKSRHPGGQRDASSQRLTHAYEEVPLSMNIPEDTERPSAILIIPPAYPTDQPPTTAQYVHWLNIDISALRPRLTVTIQTRANGGEPLDRKAWNAGGLLKAWLLSSQRQEVCIVISVLPGP
ncbi:transposable element tc1 transposase, putative [Talaromyces stipitatus ATCC 10500]|uniref:Transposable element tc1 transposase, putative n=1 Tax=Talaromyces stipitatus (strain ATCC 10500 / CBS 375.48 / QM 6759 / NRRL 1006) TaxID=441959 RepID=B8MUB8_TALSN|nr:transposable element tc1 transposase, putative [Talaromyces stipitatus ATCC 10500]XP_002488379.1 transposable element tc1 transposase, putative [Talaromyces stipitatus ATCC 10500]EED11622.1 transposable element tc1 transposase, putative [Talaromyces stipitatus ATCC 10500]EED11623.1 transposable element tc1 transposase, putative [Talaromyces stipitatus ATCC 10500]